MARKAWSELSPAYRRRLQKQGVTARSHQRGDLRRARGHAPKPVSRPAPREATEAFLRPGGGTLEQLESLRSWQYPWWIPQEISPTLAAALSYAERPPSEWRLVEVWPRGGGEPWEIRITYARGYPQDLQVPGGGRPGTDAHELLDLLEHPELFSMSSRAQQSWDDWREFGELDVHDSP